MDLKRVRTFVTVADLGTVSKAAVRRLFNAACRVANVEPRAKHTASPC